MKTIDAMKPCPCCGGKSEITTGYAAENVWPNGEFHRIFCGVCQLRQLFYKTPQEAVAAWNKREEAQTVEPVAIVTCDGVMGVDFTAASGYGVNLPVGTELFTHPAPPPSGERVALIARLRNTRNWQRESFGSWKNGTSFYDRAPFEAADMLAADAQDEWHRGRAAGIEECEKVNAELSKSAQQVENPSWRCFHCGEIFTTVGSARDHFGENQWSDPGCLIDQVALEEGGRPERGRGLLMALRKVEDELERYREEDTDLHRSIHRINSEHQTSLLRAEETGYARGLKDANHVEPAQQVEVPQGFTTGHCKEHSKPGGCQLHNLQCGYPDCDRKPAAPPPPQAERVPTADMFWNHDDAERLYKGIGEFLNDEICNGTLEVGDVRTVQQAIRLPNVQIKITSIDDESCEAEYEVIEAHHHIGVK